MVFGLCGPVCCRQSGGRGGCAAGFLVTGGPCLSPPLSLLPPRPILYKFSRLSASLRSSLPCITKGLQMARLSGSLPHKSVGFISPFSLLTHICRLGASRILFQARGRKDAWDLGWASLLSLICGAQRPCFTSEWLHRPALGFSVPRDALEPDSLAIAHLSWGLHWNISGFTVHMNCLG